MRVGVLIGSRRDAVALAPVVWSLAERRGMAPVVVGTGQGDGDDDPVLTALRLTADRELAAIDAADCTTVIESRAAQLGALVADVALDALVVREGTTNGWSATMAAHRAQIPLACICRGSQPPHVPDSVAQAIDARAPGRAVRWHFAPCEAIARRVRATGTGDDLIVVTGNPVIDTVDWARRAGVATASFASRGTRILAVVAGPAGPDHRQSAWPQDLWEAIVQITRLADAETVVTSDASPGRLVHVLEAEPGVRVLGTLGYLDFLATLHEADLLLTDSPGALEEAVALGVPSLVFGPASALATGADADDATVIGVEPAQVVHHAIAVLAAPVRRRGSAPVRRAAGGGHAARHIVRHLADRLERRQLMSPRAAVR